MNDQKWIECIRYQELLSINKYILNSNKKKILEIGGNDGYLARIMMDWGLEVTSIDINPSSTYFDVREMDATNLKFEDNSFDLIFSSSVITQIHNKNMLFKEINRVLKDDGLIIHVVSSTWWSLITNFWHYILLPKIIYNKIRNKSNSKKFLKSNDLKISIPDKNKIKTLKNLLFYHPLGVEKSFIIEIFKFSRYSWRKLFICNGYVILNELNGPLVYSGYTIFKNRGYNVRKYFARIFSSSYIFVMKKT